ncbi:hypothetical protein C8R43DRAFT_1131202 [Mycena crocata]|nr:hypothetical protein C8R43DRAFT_1131202 [Mycena crocata]
MAEPNPHSIDLLRNRAPHNPLGPFDGKAGAFVQIGTQHYFITTNTHYVPAVPSLKVPHAVFLRTDMRYGTDDPALWPQQYTSNYCHMPLIPRKGARPELDIMWWNPSPADFDVGSAVTRGLGRLTPPRFCKLLPPINELIARCKDLRKKSPNLAIHLFGELIQHIIMLLEQLQTLPSTYTKMLFALTSLQRAFLELDALYNYMTIYKQRIDNYMNSDPTDTTAVAETIGTFTTAPLVAQQLFVARVPFWLLRPVEVFDAENILRLVTLREPDFGLPDPDAHAEGAPVLYSGNSTMDKITAIRQAAVHMPWYRDPFETTKTTPDAPLSTASSSVPAVQPPTPATSSDLVAQPRAGGVARSNTRPQSRSKPYSKSSKAAKSLAKSPAKSPAQSERDKFLPVVVEGMPPQIDCMATALPKVKRSVLPYTTDGADKQYILPEPALLVNTTPERRRKLLHHWKLLADGFVFMLTQGQPQPLSAAKWRDVLEGLITKHGHKSSRTYRRSANLEDRLHPALEASNLATIEGFPVSADRVPELNLKEIHQIVWQVAETSFRFEFASLDGRASGKKRLEEVQSCFAGRVLVGVPLEFSKCGWAAATLEDRHRYVGRTAILMVDWKTKSPCPMIICRVAQILQWSASAKQALETAVCEYYSQAFWEHFGRAPVLPLRLVDDVDDVHMEDGQI